MPASGAAVPAVHRRGGELWLCPICLNARGLADEEKVGDERS